MTTERPVSLQAYRIASAAVAVLAPVWLRSRARRGKEDSARWSERLGRTDHPRPEGALAWLHGVSVGESLALLPLAERLIAERPGVTVLMTCGTRIAAELLARRLPASAIHQYAPIDTPDAARRFLRHWRPSLVVLAESELWPNLILAARAMDARLALVSAKLSERSLAGWRHAPTAARAVLGEFDLVLARDEASAEQLRSLGAAVDGLADLKFGAAPLPVDGAALEGVRPRLAGRPVLLAASTHPGEEPLVVAAFRAVRADSDALLILAPRHPDRGEAVERMALAWGLTAGRRSAGAQPGEADVYVADTVGELGLWYRLASLAVLGGSLAPGGVGGHNPLEPARLGCPFVSGPGVEAWPVYRALEQAGATRLTSPDGLGDWFARAIAGDDALAAMAGRARIFVEAGDAAAGSAADRVLELLDRCG